MVRMSEKGTATDGLREIFLQASDDKDSRRNRRRSVSAADMHITSSKRVLLLRRTTNRTRDPVRRPTLCGEESVSLSMALQTQTGHGCSTSGTKSAHRLSCVHSPLGILMYERRLRTSLPTHLPRAEKKLSRETYLAIFCSISEMVSGHVVPGHAADHCVHRDWWRWSGRTTQEHFARPGNWAARV